MSPLEIDPGWITQSLAEYEHGLESDVWRAVDGLEGMATLRLVDTLAELQVLEQILAASLPPLPPEAVLLDPRLGTPFRHTGLHASRFRPAQATGIWYGADSPEAACAEVGYWRWRFLMDSEGLRGGHLVGPLTLFHAMVAGPCLNLESPPWNAHAAVWSDPRDHRACLALAEQAQAQAVQWIRYPSARSPEAFSAAVFDPQALDVVDPHAQQTWVLKVSAQRLLCSHAGERLEIATEGWV
ncbi:RES family NAD+ phosphorylase [Rhodoferax sp. WC2427]|uniref:RES family NAD+ phosphorylase n=1 Tax=Rhodoferax sp. WC2427 TaxID=3234144 RepID=UPI003467CA29